MWPTHTSLSFIPVVSALMSHCQDTFKKNITRIYMASLSSTYTLTCMFLLFPIQIQRALITAMCSQVWKRKNRRVPKITMQSVFCVIRIILRAGTKKSPDLNLKFHQQHPHWKIWEQPFTDGSSFLLWYFFFYNSPWVLLPVGCIIDPTPHPPTPRPWGGVKWAPLSFVVTLFDLGL